MPTISFHDYVQRISETLNDVTGSGDAVLIDFEVDHRSSNLGLVSGILRFNNDSALHFKEFVNTHAEEPKIMYAYHYQNAENDLVFRYDNAAHKPSLQHPHHKHLPTGIESSSVPTIIDVIDEILNHMSEG
ncbi:MAG: hypothetical protein ACI8V2_003085 [Candidatus Latescibacterota bacterium]|jgi:hypothetical protein